MQSRVVSLDGGVEVMSPTEDNFEKMKFRQHTPQ